MFENLKIVDLETIHRFLSLKRVLACALIERDRRSGTEKSRTASLRAGLCSGDVAGNRPVRIGEMEPRKIDRREKGQ